MALHTVTTRQPALRLRVERALSLITAAAIGTSLPGCFTTVGLIAGSATTKYETAPSPDDVPLGTEIRVERKSPAKTRPPVPPLLVRSGIPLIDRVEGHQGGNTAECITLVSDDGERCIPRDDVRRVEYGVGTYSDVGMLVGLPFDLLIVGLIVIWAQDPLSSPLGSGAF